MPYVVTRHPFHLVTESPWPFYGSCSTFGLALGIGGMTNGACGSPTLLTISLTGVSLTMLVWWRDIVREATFEGNHTCQVQIGLRVGMTLFILSEVMFFVSFFWTFFHSSYSPVAEIGQQWPPLLIASMDAWHIPFLNTILLLFSGIMVTVSHHAIILGCAYHASFYLTLTVCMALLFIFFQAIEYLSLTFSISDGVYGAIFYLSTGFHGFHVIIGTIFLGACLLRLSHKHFVRNQHVGFECAAWYWHMVDVVWLFLFTAVYWLCGT
jgi:heme/copper-type cytochrome/quinol oxidase subunit 3